MEQTRELCRNREGEGGRCLRYDEEDTVDH